MLLKRQNRQYFQVHMKYLPIQTILSTIILKRVCDKRKYILWQQGYYISNHSSGRDLENVQIFRNWTTRFPITLGSKKKLNGKLEMILNGGKMKTTYQNSWDANKAMLIGKFITPNTYWKKKKEKSQIYDFSFDIKKSGIEEQIKPKVQKEEKTRGSGQQSSRSCCTRKEKSSSEERWRQSGLFEQLTELVHL